MLQIPTFNPGVPPPSSSIIVNDTIPMPTFPNQDLKAMLNSVPESFHQVLSVVLLHKLSNCCAFSSYHTTTLNLPLLFLRWLEQQTSSRFPALSLVSPRAHVHTAQICASEQSLWRPSWTGLFSLLSPFSSVYPASHYPLLPIKVIIKPLISYHFLQALPWFTTHFLSLFPGITTCVGSDLESTSGKNLDQ